MSKMDTKVRIQGILTPSKDAVRSNTPSKIADALRASGLKTFVNETRCKQGSIDFNCSDLPLGGRKVGLGLVSMLADLIKAEGVAELGLAGKLTIVTDSEDNEPSVIRVTVENGKLRYQQATLLWEPELVR